MSNGEKTWHERGRATQRKNRDRLKADYYKSPKCCLQCGTPILWEKRNRVDCCSRKCATHRQHGTMPRSCPTCSKEVIVRGATHCSHQCYHIASWASRKEKILQSGKVDGDNKVSRRFLLEEHGHRCSICDTSNWCGSPIPLVVDHMNGNSTDNRLTNLRLVCCNCDAQLPTYKGRNRGNGRAYRRQRYAEGKSY